MTSERTRRHYTAATVASLIALCALGRDANAQSVSGEPPRPPGVIGPAPTNPNDTGLGTTAGTNPQGNPLVYAPPGATPTAPPVTANGEGPATPRLSIVARTPVGPATALPSLADVIESLPPALHPRPGALTADMAAERALRRNYAVAAARAGVQGAEAAQTEAALQMIPSIQLSARYTRLSDYPPASFPGFDFQGCLGNLMTCTSPGGAAMFATTTVLQPAILNQYGLRATITIPVSDIPLRLLQVYRAAGFTAEARRLDLLVQRQQAALEARLGFYEFVRAVGQRAVTEQSLAVARRRRGDLLRAVEAGTVARAELLRVDASVSDLERVALLAQNGVELAEAVLRQRIGAESSEVIAIGEGLGTPMESPGSLNDNVEQATRSRAELRSIDAQLHGLGANQFAVYAGMFPSIAVAGNADYANPNSRIFPVSEQFRGTWDVTVQASWSPTAAIVAGATASRLSAQRAQIEAQAAQLREGIELEVRNNWAGVRAAEAQIEAARAALASAEEDLRVRRERVGAGAAIGTDVADAEANVLRARLSVVNAGVDLRVARARLRRAVGPREGAE